MRRSRKLAATALAGTLLATAFGAAGASAADSDSTTVSLTVTGGSLNLDVAGETPTATLTGEGSNLIDFSGAKTYSGGLPQTTVTDERGEALAAWSVSVAANGDFDGAATAATIPASGAKVFIQSTDALLAAPQGMVVSAYESELTTKHLGADANSDGTYDAYVLVNGTSADLTGLLGLADGQKPTVEFTPQMSVSVPAGTLADTYTMTVTQTVG